MESKLTMVSTTPKRRLRKELKKLVPKVQKDTGGRRVGSKRTETVRLYGVVKFRMTN